MHKVYCIIGRSATGKSTITRKAADILNMKIIKSYTTRNLMENETIESADHIFIHKNEVKYYKDDIIAYTKRRGYCSFTTKQQLFESDFCIINPLSFYELLERAREMNIKLITIYIHVPYIKNEERAKQRGDYLSWKENFNKEYNEFKRFEKSKFIDYKILNNCSIEDGVKKMIDIIKEDQLKERN